MFNYYDIIMWLCETKIIIWNMKVVIYTILEWDRFAKSTINLCYIYIGLREEHHHIIKARKDVKLQFIILFHGIYEFDCVATILMTSLNFNDRCHWFRKTVELNSWVRLIMEVVNEGVSPFGVSCNKLDRLLNLSS